MFDIYLCNLKLEKMWTRIYTENEKRENFSVCASSRDCNKTENYVADMKFCFFFEISVSVCNICLGKGESKNR